MRLINSNARGVKRSRKRFRKLRQPKRVLPAQDEYVNEDDNSVCNHEDNRDDNRDEDYIDENMTEDYDEDSEEEETSAEASSSVMHTLEFSSNDFEKYCVSIGAQEYLVQVFNTKQTVTNCARANHTEAVKRSSVCLKRCFNLLLYCLQDMHQTNNSSSQSSAASAAANLPEDDRSISMVLIHVLKNFGYFLPKYLVHLRALGRKASTMKVVLQDFYQVFVKYFLISSFAEQLVNDPAYVSIFYIAILLNCHYSPILL